RPGQVGGRVLAVTNRLEDTERDPRHDRPRLERTEQHIDDRDRHLAGPERDPFEQGGGNCAVSHDRANRAARPRAATRALDHAHWKLKPPSRPSTSRISPTR